MAFFRFYQCFRTTATFPTRSRFILTMAFNSGQFSVNKGKSNEGNGVWFCVNVCSNYESDDEKVVVSSCKWNVTNEFKSSVINLANVCSCLFYLWFNFRNENVPYFSCWMTNNKCRPTQNTKIAFWFCISFGQAQHSTIQLPDRLSFNFKIVLLQLLANVKYFSAENFLFVGRIFEQQNLVFRDCSTLHA